MFVDVNRISGKGLLLDDSTELDENLLVEDDSFFLDNVYYNIFFKKDTNQIKVKGNIRTSISLHCVYCLESFELKINSEFDIILFPIGLIQVDNSALNPDDMEYIFYESDRIDLDKILMEQVNLFIPYNPVCSPNCLGLCPNCGINLNHQRCHCEKPVNDMSLFFDKSKR